MSSTPKCETRCDRCGTKKIVDAQIIDDPSTGDARIEPLRMPEGWSFVRHTNNTPQLKSEIKTDLCEPCTIEFCNWLAGRDVVGRPILNSPMNNKT